MKPIINFPKMITKSVLPFLFAGSMVGANINAQATENIIMNTEMTTAFEQMQNKIELKELVDRFSTLSDTKSVQEQVLLFTEDALLETYRNGEKNSEIKGRDNIAERFTSFLNQFSTVYHQSGQQIITELTETTAKGTAYCLVVLVRENGGKTETLTQGVTYTDEFVKIDGKWMFAKRASNFAWATTDISE